MDAEKSYHFVFTDKLIKLIIKHVCDCRCKYSVLLCQYLNYYLMFYYKFIFVYKFMFICSVNIVNNINFSYRKLLL